MLSLRAADILPLDVYEWVRPRHLAAILELRRRRRIELGPVSLSFECRDTVLFQIQEMVRLERADSRERVEREIAEYERLIPGPDEITATLMVHGGTVRDGHRFGRQLAARAGVVFIRVEARLVVAEELAPAVEPSCPVHYLRFPLGRPLADAVRAAGPTVEVGVRYAGRLELTQLGDPLRAELASTMPGPAAAATPPISKS